MGKRDVCRGKGASQCIPEGDNSVHLMGLAYSVSIFMHPCKENTLDAMFTVLLFVFIGTKCCVLQSFSYIVITLKQLLIENFIKLGLHQTLFNNIMFF